MKIINKDLLISIASEQLKSHRDYIDGMTITDVTQDINGLRFVGEYFIDKIGLPTEKTEIVFSVFSDISGVLSKVYMIS